jgi:hypothetical protein
MTHTSPHASVRRAGRCGSVCLMAWSARFEDPVPLPNRRKLVILKDAGNPCPGVIAVTSRWLGMV